MSSRQRYVSGELTHFVGSGKSEERQYELLVHILRTGHLWHPPFDGALTNLNAIPRNKASDHTMFGSSCICFCDIPVADFGIHVAKYSRFGIGFRKDYLVTGRLTGPLCGEDGESVLRLQRQHSARRRIRRDADPIL